MSWQWRIEGVKAFILDKSLDQLDAAKGVLDKLKDAEKRFAVLAFLGTPPEAMVNSLNTIISLIDDQVVYAEHVPEADFDVEEFDHALNLLYTWGDTYRVLIA